MRHRQPMTTSPAPVPVWRWGSRDAPTFVLLHSLGLDGGSFGWLAEAMLSRANVQLIAPDFRGHGKALAKETGVTLIDMAADVVHLLPALGIARAHLVGTSMGSAVARLAVGLAPSLWHSVTLIAGGGAAVPALAQRGNAALQGGMRAVVEETLQRWFPPAAIAQEDEFVRYARASILRMEPSAWAAAWLALATYPQPGPLPNGVPGLCVAGELDMSASCHVVETMREVAAVPEPVALVAGAAHQLSMSHASDVAKLLLRHWHPPRSAR